MSILVNKNTKVIVQGITGRSGRFHTEQCVDYGTQIVAGAVPGRGGTDVNGIPVFDTVAEGFLKQEQIPLLFSFPRVSMQRIPSWKPQMRALNL